MNRSLRTRLIAGIGGCTALLLVCAGVMIYLLMRHAMLAEIDGSLTAAAHLLIPLVEYDEGKADLDLDRLPADAHGSRENLVELWLADGSVAQRSPLLGEQNLPRLADVSPQLHISQNHLADGRSVRLAQITFTVAGEQTDAGPQQTTRVTLAVARLTQPLDHRLAQLRDILLASFASLTIGAVLIVIIVVTRTLRPVRQLSGQIAGIEHDNLGRRITVAELPAELAPLADRLNELLGRLEAAFERERHFTGDVAHELRTPLAGLRAILEVTASRPRTPADYAKAMADMNTALRGMEDMVNKLLMLARLDAAQTTPDRQAIDLRQAVNGAWAALAETAKHRRLQYQNAVPADIACMADGDLLAMVLGNLLGNAVQYADVGGRITVEATAGSQHVTLIVANSGCELQPEDAAHVFDRFWRGDAARSDTDMHSGLGLSLVQRAATVMQGQASANITPDHRFEIHIRLPRPG